MLAFRPSTWVILAAACSLGSGCTPHPAPPPPNIAWGPTANLRKIHRVVFVDLADGRQHPQVAAGLTDALTQAIRLGRHFHVRRVRRDDPVCEELPLDRPGGLTLTDMADIRRTLDCDAILYGSLTTCTAYPHMRIGLYLNLVDLGDGALVWSVEHTWDSTQQDVQRRLQQYFRSELRDAYGPAGWELGTVSPRLFQKFVAHECAVSLTPAADRPAGH